MDPVKLKEFREKLRAGRPVTVRNGEVIQEGNSSSGAQGAPQAAPVPAQGQRISSG